MLTITDKGTRSINSYVHASLQVLSKLTREDRNDHFVLKTLKDFGPFNTAEELLEETKDFYSNPIQARDEDFNHEGFRSAIRRLFEARYIEQT